MAKELMSDAEINRRKKLQGKISRTTSTLGLTGIGLLGASSAIRRNPALLRKLPKYADAGRKETQRVADKVADTSRNVGVVSGGIGGLGGYNFAAYTNAESRKKVKKSWEPVKAKPTAEQKRARRAEFYAPAAATVASATGGAAGLKFYEAGKQVNENKKISQRARNLPKVKAAVAARSASAGKSAKTGAGLAALSVASGIGAKKISDQRKPGGSWQTYSKSATSAFGVDHC